MTTVRIATKATILFWQLPDNDNNDGNDYDTIMTKMTTMTNTKTRQDIPTGNIKTRQSKAKTGQE